MWRYGKFKNKSYNRTHHVELPADIEECQNCLPEVNPRHMTPDQRKLLVWKSIDRLDSTINSISGWFRCPGDRIYKLTTVYVDGNYQRAQRFYMDPVFHTEGVMCGGAHVDWCYEFN